MLFEEQIARKPDYYNRIEDFIKKGIAIHANKYDYSKVNYVNNKTKVTIICTLHGEYQQRPCNHISGSGCVKCANELKAKKYKFKLSKKDEKWILDNYGKLSMKKCSSYLKIDIKTFRKVIKELNLQNIYTKKRIHNHIHNFYWKRLVQGALNRNLEFNITPEYIWNCLKKQNHRCRLSGQKIEFKDKNKTTASVDRIDSSKGYLEGNIQILHKTVNKLKSNIPEKQFIYWCKQISENNS